MRPTATETALSTRHGIRGSLPAMNRLRILGTARRRTARSRAYRRRLSRELTNPIFLAALNPYLTFP